MLELILGIGAGVFLVVMLFVLADVFQEVLDHFYYDGNVSYTKSLVSGLNTENIDWVNTYHSMAINRHDPVVYFKNGARAHKSKSHRLFQLLTHEYWIYDENGNLVNRFKNVFKRDDPIISVFDELDTHIEQGKTLLENVKELNTTPDNGMIGPFHRCSKLPDDVFEIMKMVLVIALDSGKVLYMPISVSNEDPYKEDTRMQVKVAPSSIIYNLAKKQEGLNNSLIYVVNNDDYKTFMVYPDIKRPDMFQKHVMN